MNRLYPKEATSSLLTHFQSMKFGVYKSVKFFPCPIVFVCFLSIKLSIHRADDVIPIKGQNSWPNDGIKKKKGPCI